jgi:hypothetical protein
MQLNYSSGAVKLTAAIGAVSASPSGSVTAYYWNGEAWISVGTGSAGVVNFGLTIWTNKILILENSGTTTSRYWYGW